MRAHIRRAWVLCASSFCDLHKHIGLAGPADPRMGYTHLAGYERAQIDPLGARKLSHEHAVNTNA